MAAREKLDNLIFVVNCNLQRLDGPVRGNGKIIQELEGVFRGAGWNVIKVIWGTRWDPLFAADHTGMLVKLMSETLDGDYQTFKSRDGNYVREHFFGKYPETRALVERMTDDEVWALNRGGHDPYKVYAAYKAASEHRGAPTVILAKTIKGYGMGSAGEGMNIAHQQKKLIDRAAARVPRPLLDPDLRRAISRKCRSSSRPGLARGGVSARTRREARRRCRTRRRTVEAPLAVPERSRVRPR